MAMKKEFRNILLNAREELVTDMDAEVVLLKMAASMVFDEADEGKIRSENTREKKNIKLLEILPHRGETAYDSFKIALQNGNTKFLADILTKAENTELKSELFKERTKSAGLRGKIRRMEEERRISTKERETTNSPESEVYELQNNSKDLPNDHEGFDTSFNKQTYPDNNEQIQRSNDLPQDEKRCRQCYHRKMENDASREKVEALHDILSQFEVKHVEEKELFEKAKKCAKEFLERHDKEDTKEAIRLNGQMGEISLEKLRAEEIQNKQKNDDESLETENKRQIKLEQEKKKLEEESNLLASEVDAKEREIREIKDKLEEKKAECKKIEYEYYLRCKEVDQLRRTQTLKSRTVSYISLPCGDKHGLGKATDVLAHIQNKTGGERIKEVDSCFIIDLGENYRLFPTQFALQARMWRSILEGCTDDSEWMNLEIARTPLVHLKHTNLQTWLVEGNVSAFRYFRIFQTDTPGVCWPYNPFYGLELYGVLLEL